MTLGDEIKTQVGATHLELPSLEMEPAEEAFFKAETGIQNTEELRKHIIEIKEEACKVNGCSHTGSYIASWK
jgi:hypothetical protein